MGSESETFSQLEIAHVLFTDIVGYSKLPIDQQSELPGQLDGAPSLPPLKSADLAEPIFSRRANFPPVRIHPS
jgi:hypothetical protein